LSLRDLAVPKKTPRKRYTRTLTRKEVRAIKKRGYDAEREVVNMFRDNGFEALRVPVSAPSKEPLPDVFAIKNDCILAIEVKSQTQYVYVKREQVKKLHQFLNIHKIYPKKFAVLAAKFKYKGWSFKIAEKYDDYVLKMGQGLSFKELIDRID
jgi:Holliday junction resolvase